MSIQESPIINENDYVVIIPFASYPYIIKAINLTFYEAEKIKEYTEKRYIYCASIMTGKELIDNYMYEFELYSDDILCEIINN